MTQRLSFIARGLGVGDRRPHGPGDRGPSSAAAVDPGRRRLLAGALCGVPALALTAACSPRNLIGGTPPSLYNLSPKSTFPENLPVVSWQLLIDSPTAAAGLDTVRIAVQPEPLTLDYFAGVAWSDRAPLMIQTLLVESFENAGRIVAVGRETIGLRGDYILMTEVREFQAELEGPGAPRYANVVFGVKLVRMPARAIVGSSMFSSRVAAPPENFSTLIAAFDEALGDCLKSIVEWTLVTGQTDWTFRDGAETP